MPANLKTSTRARLGTRPSRVLRLQGRIPVSLQGDGKDSLQLAIEQDQFLAARRHHEHVFILEMEGGGSDAAMVNELQWDPLGERIIHVEFRRVDLLRETEAQVRLEFIGHPKGGVLNHLLSEVMVSAIPSKVPDLIEVKVDHLEIGHPLLGSDLILPEGVTLVTPAATAIAVVVLVREEAPAGEDVEEAAPTEAAPAADKAAPGGKKE